MNNRNYNIEDVEDDQDIPIKNIDESIEFKKRIRRRKKRTLKLWVWIVLLILLLIIIIFCLLKIFLWNNDNKRTKEVITQIDQDIEIVEDNENTEYVNEPDDTESDYWYYVKIPLINVNFDTLLEKNDDTIGWIQVNNTNINYPIVQYTDNDYYLSHSYDKSYNEAGWVFMDYRNNSNFENKNSIIYAHSRLDKTMFGSLSKTLKGDWYTNKDNHIIKISTPTTNSLWQIFSIYKIPIETYYITTDFNSDDEFRIFLDKIKDRSKYDFNTELNINDKILTLSTCYSDTERTVVHAKLLKKEKK